MGHRLSKDVSFISRWGFFSNLFSFQPGFLVKPPDGQEKGQEEHPEHEVGGGAEILVHLEAEIQEEEGADGDRESVGADDHDRVVLVVESLLRFLPRCHCPVLLSKYC